MNNIVCFFSASGVTKNTAQKIANTINSDIFEIIPETPYTREDLDWTNKESRSSIEMKNLEYRPQTKEKINLDSYDTIILGYPIWWDKAPTIINTFIEENNITNKNIYVFATSGGSAVENSFETLKKQYPNINFINIKRFLGNETEEDIINWLS